MATGLDNGLYPNIDISDGRIADISVAKKIFVEEDERKIVKDISLTKSEFQSIDILTTVSAVGFNRSDFEALYSTAKISEILYSKERKGVNFVMFV